MEVGFISIFISAGLLACTGYSFAPKSSEVSPDVCQVILHLYHSHIVKHLSSMSLSAEVESQAMRFYFNDLSEQILRSITQLKIQLDFFRYHPPNSWDFFNVILVDSAASFRKINPGEKTKKQDYNEFYLVVLKTPHSRHSSLPEMRAIFAYCWTYYIINVSVMIETSNGPVKVFTYFPFTERECFSSQPVQVTGRQFADLFPPKMLNFHNCSLTAALWDVPPYLTISEYGTGHDQFYGIEGRLLTELAEKMNFAVIPSTPPKGQQRGLVFKNGSVTGAIKMLQDKVAHLSLGCFRCTLERSSLLTASQSFYQTMQVYTVKAWTDPWTTFEIITYPFDTFIWTLMMVILVALILLSIGLGCRHPKASEFIFGFRRTEDAFINIIAAWLGSPVVPEPRRTFARFVLTLWLFSTLVLRNSYQGLLFTFLHSNLAKHPPDTSQELAQRGYSLIVNLASNDTFSGVPIIRDGRLNVLVKNITDAGGYPLLAATNDRLATATPKDFLSYYVTTTKKYGVFHVLKETIFSQQICIYFTKHSFLSDRFNEVLMRLRSFGLIDLWASQYIDDTYIEEVRRPPDRMPITMHQLEGVFQILIVCLLAAAIVFITELLISRLLSFGSHS